MFKSSLASRLLRFKEIALGVMAVWLGIGLLISPLLARSLVAGAYIAVGLVTCFVVGRISFARLPWQVAMWAALIAAMMLGALVLLAHFIPASKARWLANAFNNNVVAGALVLLVPFAAARLIGGLAMDRRSWWAALVAGSVALTALPFTHSRAAYAAILIALSVIAVLRWPRLMWGLIALGAAALTAGALIGWREITDALFRGDAVHDLDQRIEIWSRALMIIGDFPFTGSGPGCFEPLVARLYPLFLLPKTTVSHAHNLFLQVGVDLGLPGLIAYIATLGISVYQGLRAHLVLQRTNEHCQTMLVAACLGALAGMMSHGLLDCATWGNKLAFIPWAVMGLCSALSRWRE